MKHVRRLAYAMYDIATSFAGIRLWPPRIYWRDPKTRERVDAS